MHDSFVSEGRNINRENCCPQCAWLKKESPRGKGSGWCQHPQNKTTSFPVRHLCCPLVSISGGCDLHSKTQFDQWQHAEDVVMQVLEMSDDGDDLSPGHLFLTELIVAQNANEGQLIEIEEVLQQLKENKYQGVEHNEGK